MKPLNLVMIFEYWLQNFDVGDIFGILLLSTFHHGTIVMLEKILQSCLVISLYVDWSLIIVFEDIKRIQTKNLIETILKLKLRVNVRVANN